MAMSDEYISKADKRRISRLDNIDSAYVMLYLANMYTATRYTTVFPKELILAICWEETYFQNIHQDGGPAVGYGQLEVSGRRLANQYVVGQYTVDVGEFTVPAILARRDTSIRAVSYCLATLYERLGSQKDALDAYAGVKHRPENGLIPPRWLQCATGLQNLFASAPNNFNPIAFEDALRKAKIFDESGPVYNHIHNRLWPLLDILKGLTGQVQIGSQGPMVRILQDILNRIQNVDPSSGSSLPLLAVDGMFGPKTHARVREFQSMNRLEADGIVGPQTRGVLNEKGRSFAMA
jgi:hypothetical protein